MTVYNIYSDIDLELTQQADGDITKDTEFNAIENSIANIVATFQGSRRMIPEFAIGIYNLLFEPMDNLSSNRLGSDILEAIKQWDDRVVVKNIHVNANYDLGQYEIKITYNINCLSEETHEVDYVIRRE
jgi:phage baseplate assembly protein W